MIQGMIHSNTMMHGTLRNSLSLYGTIKPGTVPKLRKISGLPPLTYTAKEEGTLNNYRIYGNTVSGESVGDKTANLFDGNWLQGYWKFNTGEWNDSSQYIATSIIDCTPNTDYTFSLTGKPINYGFIWYNQAGRRIASNYDHVEEGESPTHYTATSPASAAFMAVNISREADKTTIVPQDVTDFMLVEGSVSSPYEPYGYRVPVIVEGKNLFDKNYFIQSNLFGQDSNRIVADPYTISTIIPCNPNTKYTISKIVTNRFIIWGCTDYPTRGEYCNGQITSDYDSSSLTFTTGNDDNYLLIMLFYKRQPTEPTIEDVKGSLMFNYGEALPYEPYHPPVTTNLYLPEQIRKVGNEAEYIDYAEQKQHRVRKNLLNISANTTVVNGISFTVNSDKSITITGNLTQSKADFDLIAINSLILNSGEYLVSCENASASANTYFIIGGSSSTGHVPYKIIDNSNSVKVSCSGGNIGYCKIRVLSNIENPITLYPMIRLASIEDDTYEPYIENTDLDVTLPALPTLPGTNTLSAGTEVQPSEVEVTGRIRHVPTGGGE